MSNNVSKTAVIYLMGFLFVSCGAPQNTSLEDGQTNNIMTQEVDVVPAKAQLSESEIIEARSLASMGLDSSQKLEDFFEIMRTAAKSDDRETIANLISYPFEIYINEDMKSYKTKSEFLRDYGIIVTPDVQNTFENASYEDFWANYRGGMINHGMIWFNIFDNEIKIFRING